MVSELYPAYILLQYQNVCNVLMFLKANGPNTINNFYFSIYDMCVYIHMCVYTYICIYIHVYILLKIIPSFASHNPCLLFSSILSKYSLLPLPVTYPSILETFQGFFLLSPLSGDLIGIDLLTLFMVANCSILQYTCSTNFQKQEAESKQCV